MVSTRGPKYKFAVGERVLCYEPDPTKAKVLYDSKVIEIVEEKDKKGRRTVEYVIHFQGWNSSWDRAVQEEFVLKDTDKNRQLQRDLAEKSQLQIGAYLYRKERKKRKRSSTNVLEVKTPFRPSSDDGSSCCSTTPGSVIQEEITEPIARSDTQSMDTHDSDSCSSSAESVVEGDRVALQLSDNLKRFLEYDQFMITKKNKLVDLPAKLPIITILENYVKYCSIKSICGPINGVEGPRRRNSSAKNERKEKDYDKLRTSINLRKEVADGLRIYFDFILKDYLLYKQEIEQASVLLSAENLKYFTFVGSEKQIRQPDGKIICYEWSNSKWNSLGDVVGAAGGTQGTSGKTLYEAKEYYYVFTVDISDNAPALKLPYNRGEDPWMSAQKFIHTHELPQAYLDQVANFIIKNSDNAPVSETALNTSYQDPFTGGGRYIPGSSGSLGSSGGNVDPFTGASSYSTQSSASVPVNFIPKTENQNSSKTSKHFPFNQYISIVTCDPAKVLAKLRDFNASLSDESLKVTELDLENAIKTVSGDYSAFDVNVMNKLLNWPKENLFPVLDIVRMVVCDANICSKFITQEVLNLIIQNINVPPANQLMSIRILLNMLGHGYGRGLIETCLTNVLVAISTTKKGSANFQVAISTLLLNLTIGQLGYADENQCQQITESIIDFLLWNADPEALYRSYRAIGNLLTTQHAAIISAQLISTDQVMDALRNNMSVQQQYGFEHINDIARDIVNAL